MLESRPTTHTYEDYLNTPDDERWELLRGELFMVPGPNTTHQRITFRLARILGDFVEQRGLGEVFIAPYDVLLSQTNVLQPDIVFVSREQQSIITEVNIQGVPALVVEVISPSTASKDRESKREIYAESGVREYWLVDPDTHTISVLALHGKEFQEAGQFAVPDTLSSPTLPGLALDLAHIFPSS